MIEREAWWAGASVHSGTIPSKTLRHAILYLTGFNERSFYGRDYRLREHITRDDIGNRVRMIVAARPSTFGRNSTGIALQHFDGTARFLDPHTVEMNDASERTTVRGDYVLIACGTRPAQSPAISRRWAAHSRHRPTPRAPLIRTSAASRPFRFPARNHHRRWGNHRS